MKTILVATDFSPAALSAANYAAEMAVTIGADILLLHVFHLPISYYDVPVEKGGSDFMIDAEAELNKLRNVLDQKNAGKINIETELVNDDFYSGLRTVCERVNPYLVVMGSQGTTAAERFVFGGHTVHAMQHLMWPMIAVPVGAKFSTIKKIGLACDFHEWVSTTPIDEIKALLADFKAELYVLNVRKVDKPIDREMVFESTLLREMLLPIKPVIHLIKGNDVEKEIMEFAKTENIDLLMVLPKRHSLLEKLMKRSHTKQLVLYSHVPVLALQPEIY